jgi:hypothetical protein
MDFSHPPTLLTCPGDVDIEKFIGEGIVCAFPLTKAEAMVRGTVVRHIFNPLSR